MAAQPQKPAEIIFQWEGRDKRGKRIKGELRGPDRNLVRAELRRQGVTPLRVRRKPKPLFEFGGNIKPKDITLFTRHLYTMVNAGIPLVQALEMAGSGWKKPKLRNMIGQLRNDVAGGNTLTEALRRHPAHFDDLYCSLVKAGEEAGVLEMLLQRVATYKEKTEFIKGRVKRAMIYPATILTVAIVVTAVILIMVVPQFETLFRSVGADLPAFTRMVITISEIAQKYWWLGLIVLILAVVLGIRGYKHSTKFRRGADRFMLKVPILGRILYLSANARYARTLSTMFASGVPLVEALDSVAGATGNAVFSDAVLEMKEQVASGQQLNFAMRQTGVFPDMVSQMTAIGEESGSLSDMLGKAADFYEEDLDNMINALTTLMEPVIMVILGVLVGGLVTAMYLPIFRMGTAL